MREFMDYVHSAFYSATGWNRDSSYSTLNVTSDALLDFPTPRGLRFTLSALASPNFATSYQLGSVGVVDGSISYLFSSVPLRVALTPQSDTVTLPELLRSYRPLTPLTPARQPPSLDLPQSTGQTAASLLYGRLYLPQSQLEGLVVRRLSPALQVQFSAVSAQHLRNGGTALGVVQYDVGRYALEGLASTDSGLLGLRGVYNFGGDAEHSSHTSVQSSNVASAGGNERERIYGRFSTGAEIYYGTMNKSGGISLGARFATLPSHKGTPLTATLTMNPLMGNIAASYAVVAGQQCSLATRMEFNAFSYESNWVVGMELWRKPLARRASDDEDTDLQGLTRRRKGERSFKAKLEWRLDPPEVQDAEASAVAMNMAIPSPLAQRLDQPARVAEATNTPKQQDPVGDAEYAGVLKARLDQNLKIGVLWEGRVQSLLFSLGSGIDLRQLDKPFRTLGLEIQFSS